VDLERDVELAAFLGRLEEQGVAQGAAGKTRVLTALGAESRRAEGDTEGIGIDRLEPEGRAVGADGFHANGALPDAGSQLGADGAEPFAWVAGTGNEALSNRLQPDDLALFDPDCLFLFRQSEGLGGGKARVNEHDAGRGARHQAARVVGRVPGIAVREDGRFGRLALKLVCNSPDRVLVCDRVDDMVFGQLGIERFGECTSQLGGRQLKRPASQRMAVMIDRGLVCPRV
jgi:hypothetical protein